MPAVPFSDAQPPLILALDLGSSSLRAVLFDAQARLIEGHIASQPHAFRTATDGAAEDDANAVFEGVVHMIDGILNQIGRRSGEVGGVALDTYVTNVLGVGDDGLPVTPVYTYADTRAAAEAAQLRRQFSEAEVLDRTGCLLRASYLPARFAWLRRARPDELRRARRWIGLGAYIFDRLLGQAVLSVSAAAWTGLLNRRSLEWDTRWLDALGLAADQLPRVVDAGQAVRGLKPEWAARWPPLRDVPWFPALGDGAAANVGSGCVSPVRLALSLGTTGAMRVTLPGTPETIPAGLWCYRVNRELALLGGATNEGGNVYAWLQQTLQLDMGDEFDRALAALEPDGHGLTALPFLAGERSPGYAGNARAALVGLSRSTRPIDIARAMLEALAYRLALIAGRIVGAIPVGAIPRDSPPRDSPPRDSPSPEIIASGGGLLGHPALMQIFADVLNRPLTASAETQATARGAALIALNALGVIPALDALPAALGETFFPDPARRAIYARAIERQVALYDQLVQPED